MQVCSIRRNNILNITISYLVHPFAAGSQHCLYSVKFSTELTQTCNEVEAENRQNVHATSGYKKIYMAKTAQKVIQNVERLERTYNC